MIFWCSNVFFELSYVILTLNIMNQMSIFISIVIAYFAIFENEIFLPLGIL